MLSGGHWYGAPSIDGTPQYVNLMPPVVGFDASKRDQRGGPVARTSHGRVQHSEQGRAIKGGQVNSRKKSRNGTTHQELPCRRSRSLERRHCTAASHPTLERLFRRDSAPGSQDCSRREQGRTR